MAQKLILILEANGQGLQLVRPLTGGIEATEDEESQDVGFKQNVKQEVSTDCIPATAKLSAKSMFERIGSVMFMVGGTPPRLIGQQFQEVCRQEGFITVFEFAEHLLNSASPEAASRAILRRYYTGIDPSVKQVSSFEKIYGDSKTSVLPTGIVQGKLTRPQKVSRKNVNILPSGVSGKKRKKIKSCAFILDDSTDSSSEEIFKFLSDDDLSTSYSSKLPINSRQKKKQKKNNSTFTPDNLKSSLSHDDEGNKLSKKPNKAEARPVLESFSSGTKYSRGLEPKKRKSTDINPLCDIDKASGFNDSNSEKKKNLSVKSFNEIKGESEQESEQNKLGLETDVSQQSANQVLVLEISTLKSSNEGGSGKYTNEHIPKHEPANAIPETLSVLDELMSVAVPTKDRNCKNNRKNSSSRSTEESETEDFDSSFHCKNNSPFKGRTKENEHRSLSKTITRFGSNVDNRSTSGSESEDFNSSFDLKNNSPLKEKKEENKYKSPKPNNYSDSEFDPSKSILDELLDFSHLRRPKLSQTLEEGQEPILTKTKLKLENTTSILDELLG